MIAKSKHENDLSTLNSDGDILCVKYEDAFEVDNDMYNRYAQLCSMEQFAPERLQPEEKNELAHLKKTEGKYQRNILKIAITRINIKRKEIKPTIALTHHELNKMQEVVSKLLEFSKKESLQEAIGTDFGEY